MKSILAVMLLALVSVDAYEFKFRWRANSETNVVKYKLTYGTANSLTNAFDIIGRTTTNTSILLYSTNTYYFQLQAVNDLGVESNPTSQLTSSSIIPPADDFRIIGVQVSTNLSSWKTLMEFTNFTPKTTEKEFYRLTIK